eukprot:scaffold33997_cov65-Phaeocystis_antarctica.AAC.5
MRVRACVCACVLLWDAPCFRIASASARMQQFTSRRLDRFGRMLAPMPAPSVENTTASDIIVDTSTPKYSATSLPPTKPRTSATDLPRYSNWSTIWATIVYRARRPRMAKALDVKAMKGSFVTPKTAGIESTAKTTSEISTHTSATSSGVTTDVPLSSPSKVPPPSSAAPSTAALVTNLSPS